MTAARGLAFAAAERVIDRIHRDAAVMRTLAEVARASGFAVRHVLVLEIADLSDRRVAAHVHLAHLARGKTERRPVTFARHELRAGAGRTNHLSALPFLQLDVVNHRAEGDLRERKSVADQDVRLLARHDRRADRETVRREDVALLAVHIVEQRDVRGSVRIILNRGNLRGNPALVALEVDVAILLLVASADEAGGHATFVVAAARLRLALGERLLGTRLRDVFIRSVRREPDSGRRWFV